MESIEPLSKMESGRRRMDSLELNRLAAVLGTDPNKALDHPSGTDSKRSWDLKSLRRKGPEIKEICRKHGARNIRLFGSVARGEVEPESDVDFLVDIEPGRTLMDHAALVRDLQALLECEVDVANAKALRERVRSTALTEAIPL